LTNHKAILYLKLSESLNLRWLPLGGDMTDEKTENNNNLGQRTDKKLSGKTHSSLHSTRGHSYTLMGTLLEDEYKHFAQQESIKKEGKSINKIILGKGSFGTVRLAQGSSPIFAVNSHLSGLSS
jgi:hypothetical protein